MYIPFYSQESGNQIQYLEFHYSMHNKCYQAVRILFQKLDIMLTENQKAFFSEHIEAMWDRLKNIAVGTISI